jgi:nitrilase
MSNRATLPKVAALQMSRGARNGNSQLESNLAHAAELIDQAVKQGAKLLVLPEYFAYHGCGNVSDIARQEQSINGSARQFLAEQARHHKVWIVGGTIPVKPSLLPSATSGRTANQPNDGRAMASCFVVSDQGEEVACYQKMHLFDVQVDDAKGSYCESDDYCHGDQPVLVDTPFGKLGLTVCYDLRFPELYRYLSEQGAELIVVPSAFTAKTGEAHWQLLLRARAVENLCYVVGANMGDRTHPKRPTWGGSAIVDPWGNVMAELGDGPGVVTADIDLIYLKKLRQNMPVDEHRRFSVVKPII